MIVELGRKPRKFPLPTQAECHFELRKLNQGLRGDFLTMLARGTNHSSKLRFIWDNAVVGFCLPSTDGKLNYPSRDHSHNAALKDEAYDGIDEELTAMLQAAFFVQNRIWNDDQTRAYEVILKVGPNDLPEGLLALISDTRLATPEEQEIMDGILGPREGGDDLGN